MLQHFLQYLGDIIQTSIIKNDKIMCLSELKEKIILKTTSRMNSYINNSEYLNIPCVYPINIGIKSFKNNLSMFLSGYFGDITREEVEIVLKDCLDTNGIYIVRNSVNNPTNYFLKENEKYFFIQENQKFTSLKKLVQFYETISLPINTNNIFLIYPFGYQNFKYNQPSLDLSLSRSSYSEAIPHNLTYCPNDIGLHSISDLAGLKKFSIDMFFKTRKCNLITFKYNMFF
ncbi:hypothetical protein HZS_4212 [Henneguya salminicola]|nr:hypothetical protein HZS_4212 [Henneguya salminicola]